MEGIVCANVAIVRLLKRLPGMGEKLLEFGKVLFARIGCRQLADMWLDQHSRIEDLHDRLRFQCAIPRVGQHETVALAPNVDAGPVPDIDDPDGLKASKSLPHSGGGDRELGSEI